MEDVLKEILYELKEIRKEIRVVGGNSNPKEVKVTIGEDTIINTLNKEMKNQGRPLTFV